MTHPVATAFQPGQVVAGKYRIESTLGEGGMGQVLLATHLDLQEQCAVKVLHSSALSHPDAYDRFVREARVARQLKSQHAVKVYDFGRLESGEPYIVMELLEGTDLRKLLQQRGALPVQEAVLYVTQACESLAEAHAAGVVHRDLKPANLFLTRGVHGRPWIKVVDFGIAKMTARPGTEPEREMTGQAMMGTLAYMSPEQMLSSRSVDHRADIWSMGVVLFKLLTNRLPFEDTGDGLGIVNSVLNSTPLSLADFEPPFPPGLCAAVACCLQKDRELRYPSALDLADVLSPFLPQEPRLSSARISRWEHTVDATTRRIQASVPSSPSMHTEDRTIPLPRTSAPSAVTGAPISAPAIPPSSRAPLSAPSAPRSAGAVPLAVAGAPVALPEGQTDPSWARTGRRMPEKRSRLWWLPVGLLAAGGIGAAGWRLALATHPDGQAASEPAIPASAGAAAHTPPSMPPSAAAQTSPAASVAPQTTEAPGPAGQAAAPAGQTPSSALNGAPRETPPAPAGNPPQTAPQSGGGNTAKSSTPTTTPATPPAVSPVTAPATSPPTSPPATTPSTAPKPARTYDRDRD